MVPEFGFANYRYLGLGSMWFVDFVLAHRVLGINDLSSVELKNPDRAEFNRPYACIAIRVGASSTVLEAMTDVEWNKPAIVWFDYDGVFDEDARSDCTRLGPRTDIMLTRGGR